MNLDLEPDDEEYLKNKVEAGYYLDIAEAIRDAVRRLREADEQYNRTLYNAVIRGEREIAPGQHKPYTSSSFEQIQRNADRKVAEYTASEEIELSEDDYQDLARRFAEAEQEEATGTLFTMDDIRKMADEIYAIYQAKRRGKPGI